MALPGFETETAPLTDEEREVLLPFLVARLRLNVGKGRAATSSRIIAGFKAAGHNVGGPRLRKLIHHARVTAMLPALIATSNGYYIATEEREIKDYIQSLRGREEAIREVRLSVERQMNYHT